MVITITNAKNLKRIDPNDPKNYLTKEAFAQLETFETRWITDDVSEVRFILWTPENGSENHFEFEAGVDPSEILKFGFDPKRQTKFISHGWNSGYGFGLPFVKGIFWLFLVIFGPQIYFYRILQQSGNQR